VARALPGDADNSQDYPGFPRQHAFIISDYSEDNPAEADFPISHPLPLDANHVEAVHVRGHRFVIRYQLPSGSPPTVYQTQLYYEKLAAAGGFQVAKSGAVGDVSETFCRTMANHDIWVSIEPSNDMNVLTVIEAPRGSTPIVPPPPPLVSAAPPPSAAPAPASATSTAVASAPPPPPASAPAVAEPTPLAAPAPPSPPVDSTASDPNGEALYASLIAQGRVVVPFDFQPNKDDLDTSSQALVDRIVKMMKKHSDLSLRIEGHTDNSGDPEDNMRLSAQRAYSVRSKIIADNIDGKRLDAVGVGGLQPIADNATAEGREKNRRIELVVWKRYSHHDSAPGTGA
jgi:outer membrane protein OmpA-like peptidoglycan-associated protein